ncbi:MAG: YcfL family protein [Pseudomonadales bacterium]|nr:YcfL family protein [Pseudomonadales bacterium]
MKTYLLIGLLISAIGLSGCATSGMEAEGKPTDDPKYAKHLVIHNEALAAKIIIQEMHTRTARSGVLEVSVVLANLTSTDKNIQYRFSWYDADNFEVEQGSRAWTPVILHGKSKTSMQALAPNPTVTTYKVNVKELK